MSYRELAQIGIARTKYGKIAPPCSENEITATEAYSGYSFPEELKRLLRELNGDGRFLLSAEEIRENVRLNREILREAFEDEAEFFEKVDRHIFFATNGCGDYYGYRVLDDGTTDESRSIFGNTKPLSIRLSQRISQSSSRGIITTRYKPTFCFGVRIMPHCALFWR